jgi:RNA polymerase sigma-70 factor (ECF subfamily)
MKRISNGDQAAFNELYERYNERLFYYFFRMLGSCEETANDFLQDIFLKIIDKPELFNPDFSFRKWIFSVAHNMCKNEYRNRENRKNVLQGLTPNEVVYETDDFEKEKIRLIELAFREMNGLTEKSKEVLLLKYRENFSVEEMAEILELPVGTIKSRLYYARNELSGVLKRIKIKEDE